MIFKEKKWYTNTRGARRFIEKIEAGFVYYTHEGSTQVESCTVRRFLDWALKLWTKKENWK